MPLCYACSNTGGYFPFLKSISFLYFVLKKNIMQRVHAHLSLREMIIVPERKWGKGDFVMRTLFALMSLFNKVYDHIETQFWTQNREKKSIIIPCIITNMLWWRGPTLNFIFMVHWFNFFFSFLFFLFFCEF